MLGQKEVTQMPDKTIKATYQLKYDCKGSRRYATEGEDFPIKDVYVLRPWCNEVKEFELTIKAK